LSNIFHDPSSDTTKLDDDGELIGSFKDLLFNNEGEPNSSKYQQFLSHAQADMVQGLSGSEVAVSFNSEERLQRDQILAALRKLDSGNKIPCISSVFSMVS